MAANNDAPIQLHPDLDERNKTAFINENFRKLSDAFNPLRISDGSNDRIIIGRYEASEYGIVGVDKDGTRRCLIGVNPKTGAFGVYVSKPGVDVITELNL